MFKTYQMTIDVVQKEVIPTITFHQDDYNTAKLLIIVRENGTILPLTQAKVRVVIKKKDNTFGWLDCDVTNAEGGEVGFILSSNSLAEPGIVECALYIYKQDQTLVTPRFHYQVEAALIPNGTVESSNEFQALNKIIADSKALIESADKIGEIVEKADDVKKLIDEGSKLQSTIDNTKAAADRHTLEIGKLSTLKTSDKTSLVAAINSLQLSGGGGVLSFETFAELQQAYPNGSGVPVWISSEQSWYYWEDASVPDTKPPNITASPNGGTFSSSQSVVLIADEAATIYYTLDGSTPTTGSAIYTAPITISTTKTLKFFGKDTAGNVSAVQSLLFTINTGGGDTTPPIVTANPAAGTYNNTQSVTLSANETATIYYTLDGSTPTVNSAVYNSPISVANSLTLKYFGKDTAGNISSVQTAVYTINKETTPGSVLFNDTFNRPDSPTLGISDSGHTWTDYRDANGTVILGVRNGMAYLSGGTWTNALNKFKRFTTIPISTNNFVIEVQTKSLPADTGDSLGICIRMLSQDRDMVYLLKPKVSSPSGKYVLAKIPYGGNVTTLGTSTSLAAENDTIKIEHHADGTIKVFINGVLEITATDTLALIATTNVGIGINADFVGLGIDSFKVTSL